jgi:potassium inwardly-rectifying channel subfamily J, other
MVGTSIRALMVRNRLTDEGECIPLCQYPFELETETTRSDAFLFLKWPVTVVHYIKDETSPLWDLSAEDLESTHFEIIVVMEGTIESTGMLTQVDNLGALVYRG